MRLAGLYMAAGRSIRMGARKLDAEWVDGQRLGAAALRALADCGVEKICAVVGPDDPLGWLPAGVLEDGTVGGSEQALLVTPCGEADLGMSYSLKHGIRSLQGWNPDAVLVVLADQPFVTGAWLRELIRLFREGSGLDYAASGVGDVVMPPVILSWGMCMEALEQAQGDRGAGSLIASGRYKGQVMERAEAGELLFDVDTPEDLVLARGMAGLH